MDTTTPTASWSVMYLLVIFGLLPLLITADIPCYTDHGTLNKAVGKTVSTSSQASGTHAMVVDGNRLDYLAYCLHTLLEEDPWLIMDLGTETSISTIVIVTHTATSELWAQVGQTFDVNSFHPTLSGYEKCNIKPFSMMKGEVLYIHCETTLLGRFVLVFAQTTISLKLCEVEVYEEQVFQNEKWTCILPDLVRPEGLLNIARGKLAYQDSIADHLTGPENAVNGDDEGYPPLGSCIITTHEISWWVVDLGQVYPVTGVAITYRSDVPEQYERLQRFHIFVGNNDGPSTPFQADNYELCVWMCKIQSSRRRYYKCVDTLRGRHVAVYKGQIRYLEMCEVEVYSDDLNDVSFPSFGPLPNLTLPGQEVLYDDNDTTCLLMNLQYPTTHSLPVVLELPWDPESKTGQRDEASNYFCNQRFFVNVTLSSDLQAFVSQRYEGDVILGPKVVGMIKECPLIGQTDSAGFVRSKFSCTCTTKCTVSVQIRQKTFGQSGGKKICTINLYN